MIIGGSGYIGSKLLELIPKNDEVYLLVRNPPKIKLPFKYIHFDLRNPDFSILSNFDLSKFTLVNLAWSSLNNFYSYEHFEQAFSHFKLVEFLVKNGLKSVIYTGTCLEYGNIQGCLNEELNCNPEIPYALAKYMTYLMIKNLQINYKFNLSWLRLFYIYGGNESRKTLWNIYNEAIIGDKFLKLKSSGNQIRDYIHIDKLCMYIFKISKLNKNIGIVNICSGEKRTIIETLNFWNNITGYECVFEKGNEVERAHEPSYFWGSKAKLSRILNLK